MKNIRWPSIVFVYKLLANTALEKTTGLAFIVLALTFGECFAGEILWPKMREIEDGFIVNTQESVNFVKPLHDVSGVVKYVFVCKGGSDKYLDELEERTDITYVGVLGCRLSEGNKETGDSLLSEDEVAPWHTRGQYRSFDEIVGDCGKYPEYGSVRHFRLRGFELTLSATNLIYDEPHKLQSFKMHVSLRRNNGITSSRAEQPGYLTPYRSGRGCGTIMKGNDPRMCRNWGKGGAWEPCND